MPMGSLCCIFNYFLKASFRLGDRCCDNFFQSSSWLFMRIVYFNSHAFGISLKCFPSLFDSHEKMFGHTMINLKQMLQQHGEDWTEISFAEHVFVWSSLDCHRQNR